MIKIPQAGMQRFIKKRKTNPMHLYLQSESWRRASEFECSGEAGSSRTKQEPSLSKKKGSRKQNHLTILDSWYYTSLLLPFHPPEATYHIVESFWNLLFWQKHQKGPRILIFGSSTALLPISCDIGGTISSQCSPVLSCSSPIMQNFQVILESFLAQFP